MIKIGMLIGDRYEILEKIGTGGMSDVYKAKCHKLNRFVAVKVLKQEFSENTNFVSKFRIEAQAAAGLMHPNIVNVYDVGEENGIYYIVMELVEGITLKKYIEKKARLSVKEAVTIAIQVSMGIEAAHNNHIIHRDIKPQNIIISKEGKVKVTDFGIAKAATSNTITSNVMGSVHYTSPEQARGGYSDEKSDIYSLGITLFEMLTGRVPFNGETTVAIAIKHIQEPMPSPRDYVPEIPVSVEQIVFKCTQKSPDRRYQSMPELVEDLKRSLINPDDDFVKVIDVDGNGETRAISDREFEKIKKQSARRDDYEESLRLNDTGRVQPPARPNRQTRPKQKAVRVEEPEVVYEDEAYNPKMEKLTTVLAVIAAVIIGLIVIFLAGKAFGLFGADGLGGISIGSESGKGIMPDIVGKTLEEAKKELRNAGIDYEIRYEESQKYGADVVLSASVNAGEKVGANQTVSVVVSAGQNGVAVPDVTGKSEAEATAILEKEGFVVSKAEGNSDTVEKGNIISQSPKGGEKAPLGSSISIIISAGSDNSNKVAMPQLVGLSEMDATVQLTELGLNVGNVEMINHEDPAYTGLVCYQSYSVGTYVELGTAVDLKVSTGPENARFSYNASIDSPAMEDPQYQPGTSTQVILTTAEGIELMRTTTSSFPIAVNFSGIEGSGTGVITFVYDVTTDAATTTDENGETVTLPGTTQQKTTQRAVAFTPES
ncbi:MAG: Stk1 family PASTA domain-containing Ser/Thr kinase [Clostridiales bacterium]|nr:Stk1 family PASTA domain-containing Ser/Thr kinase [Clostridiales bacterium]